MGGSRFHAPFIDAVPELDLVAVVTTDADPRAAAPGTDIVGSVDCTLAVKLVNELVEAADEKQLSCTIARCRMAREVDVADGVAR